ncbi:MAG: hypothetical protein ACRDK2_00970 [Solirubrobacteraceae bacterium]
MTSRALTVVDLERWTLFGAHWHVMHLSTDEAVVELCACTGEPVERLQSHDPAVIEHLHMTQADIAPH